MRNPIYALAAAACLLSASPVFAKVDKLDAGETVLNVEEDGLKAEIREAAAPGNSVRLYLNPRKIDGGEVNCLAAFGTVIPDAFHPSDVTKIAKYFGPEAALTSVMIDMDKQAHFHDVPDCSTGKWGWVSVPVVQEGTAVYYISGLKKDYEIRITFGPDPKNSAKTIVSQLQSHHKK